MYDIGAVCTIIAEMFKNNNIGISRESAILLYYGIISNTVNLKSKITTQKDVDMLEWLKHQCDEIDDKLIVKIFEEKSKIDIKQLRRFLEMEEKFVVNKYNMIIGQIEMVNALEFLKEHKAEINNVISNVYKDYGIQFVFINLVDILNGYHLIYACDDKTISFLEDKLNAKFVDGVYKEDIVISAQAKETTPTIEYKLSGDDAWKPWSNTNALNAGTYNVRAKSEAEAAKLKEDALMLQEIGCFALVLEKIPADLAREVTESLSIPTIGIGAGSATDGQVLVMQDMLGINQGFSPRFLRRYADLGNVIVDAIGNYVSDVKAVDFPNESEQY